LIFLGILGT